jgi:chitinase
MKRLILLFLILCGYYASGQRYKVIAYTTSSDSTISLYPLEKISHLIYSFLKLQNDTLTFHNERQEQVLHALVSLKKIHPHLKIMVSVGGWGGCASCSELFSTEEHRRTFARTAVDLFRKYQIDGLDLDWEYPAIEGYPGHPFSSSDRDNFTSLVKTIREEMDTGMILSFAAGGFEEYLENSIDWKKVLPQVDFVNLMTYDLVGGYSTVTGHHTPLGDNGSHVQSVTKCVNWLLAHHTPPEKLIVGAAFYARVWENVPDTNRGLYQAGHFKQGVAFRDFAQYFTDSSGYNYYWDRDARAPFQYSSTQKLFATFDDERSVKKKALFVRKNKLGGMMFWELAQDKERHGLVAVIYDALK